MQADGWWWQPKGYRFKHVRRQIAAEMVAAVARYLGDPSLDTEGRRQVVRDQCQFTDGHSAARVTAAVIDELGGSIMSGSGKVRLKADATSSRRSA